MNNYAPHNRNTRLNISATIYNILCGFSSRKVFDEYVCFWIRDISFQVFFRNFSVIPNLPLEFCLFATEWTQEFGSIKKFGKKKSLPHSFCRKRGRDEIRLFATVESLAQIALCKFGKLLCGEVFLVRQSVSLPLYAFFEHVAHISGISEVAVLMAHHAVEPVF